MSKGATVNQTNQLLKYLQTHQKISPMTALRRLGIYRLAARICDLRESGYSIRTDLVKNGTGRHAVYTLLK